VKRIVAGVQDERTAEEKKGRSWSEIRKAQGAGTIGFGDRTLKTAFMF